jgi:Tfp pilus assembly protein PilF
MSLSTRVLALVVLTLAAPACKKAGTSAPGGGSKGLTVAESDAKRTTAQGLAKARTLVGLANEDLSKGRWVSARERAKRALETEPNNADAFAVLGAANWRAGDYEGSTKAFKEALELDAKNFGAAVGLAATTRPPATTSRRSSCRTRSSPPTPTSSTRW